MKDWTDRIILWICGIAGLYWLWQHPNVLKFIMLLIALILLLCACIWWLRKWEQRPRMGEGYWVQYIDLMQEGFCIAYHEGKEELFFEGKDKVFFPSPEHWDERMPDWAKGRRDEIIERVRRHFPRLC